MSNNLGKHKAIGKDFTTDRNGITVKIFIPNGASHAFVNYAKLYTGGKVGALIRELASDKLRELLDAERAIVEAETNKKIEEELAAKTASEEVAEEVKSE